MAGARNLIDEVLSILRDALTPFVEEILAARYGETTWIDEINKKRPPQLAKLHRGLNDLVYWTPDDILNTISIGEWNVFKSSFKSRSIRPSEISEDRVAKGWIEELLEIRKRSMHQEPMTDKEVTRFLDTADLLLRAINANKEADKVVGMLPRLDSYYFTEEVLTLEFLDYQTRYLNRARVTLEGQVVANVEGFKLFESALTMPPGGAIENVGGRYSHSQAAHFLLEPGVLGDSHKFVRILATALPKSRPEKLSHWFEAVNCYYREIEDLSLQLEHPVKGPLRINAVFLKDQPHNGFRFYCQDGVSRKSAEPLPYSRNVRPDGRIHYSCVVNNPEVGLFYAASWGQEQSSDAPIEEK